MPSSIRIRMYNVGFGDCFLVFLPSDQGERKVLIDCGSIKKKRHSIDKISTQLISEIIDSDGVPRVDILILSHRHKDHLSGFDEARWAAVEVGEVWMPWIESPTDPEARQITREQVRAATALRRAAFAFNNSESLLEIANNALDGASELEVVRSGFAKKVTPRYLPEGRDTVEKISTPLLPGIEIFALGPPRNRDALNQPDPPTEQTLLSGFLVVPDGTNPEKRFQPFGPDWVLDSPEIIVDQEELRQAASMIDMYELAAAEIDADINNTSLILIFRVGDHYLLFPGDAQWGPWQLLLADEGAVELLKKVSFVKISHHASHNGSPKTLMRDVLGKENHFGGALHAMISVTPRGGWPGIPHHPILQFLNDNGSPYVLSDAFRAQANVQRKGDLWFELTLDA
ncbi:hypothetical protein [Rhizobium sp. BT-175]|uniref:hypothetical protein n=1 Tax=Rhizobium sp. BT-175 TaxID=2986929 RepID=UPI0022356C3B|nr:hypothetical protein [Rhizobium sp. BT-175]MCV9945131.1 hypothetical protein [Rhizobium sp. BT-175]